MPVIIWIVLSTTLISLIAFTGALVLFLSQALLKRVLLLLVAFSAGALIGGSLLHLLPEALTAFGTSETAVLKIFFYFLLGFLLFFVLEQFIKWHHHHAPEHPEIMPFSYLVLVSDGVHNFIDGLIIAGSFVMGLPLGVATALAVALHEIPQEIGDFGLLVYGGFKRTKALLLNFASALTIVIGGLIGFLLSEKLDKAIMILLPLAAGSFIYIAAADLIPEIRHRVKDRETFLPFFVFLAGLVLMSLLKLS